LGVAVTHLEDCRIDLDQFAVRVLEAAGAVFAVGHDDLVTGAAGIARTPKDFARHQQESRVIVQPLVVALLDCLHRFAKCRQRFRTDFEAQNVPDEFRPAPSRGPSRNTRESRRETLARASSLLPHRALPASGEASTVPHAPAPTPPSQPRAIPPASMHRGYTLIFRAPHRLDTERSDTKSTFESSRIAIAPFSASSRPCEQFLRRPRALRERSVRNLSNENVLVSEQSENVTP
jgi:hypothetical protein